MQYLLKLYFWFVLLTSSACHIPSPKTVHKRRPSLMLVGGKRTRENALQDQGITEIFWAYNDMTTTHLCLLPLLTAFLSYPDFLFDCNIFKSFWEFEVDFYYCCSCVLFRNLCLFLRQFPYCLHWSFTLLLLVFLSCLVMLDHICK